MTLTNGKRKAIDKHIETMQAQLETMRAGLATQGADGLVEELESIIDNKNAIRSILEDPDSEWPAHARIVVHVEEGLVQNVDVPEPLKGNTRVFVHDYDIEGAERDTLSTDAEGHLHHTREL